MAKLSEDGGDEVDKAEVKKQWLKML